MHRTSFVVGLVALATLAAGCSSTPASTSVSQSAVKSDRAALNRAFATSVGKGDIRIAHTWATQEEYAAASSLAYYWNLEDRLHATSVDPTFVESTSYMAELAADYAGIDTYTKLLQRAISKANAK